MRGRDDRRLAANTVVQVLGVRGHIGTITFTNGEAAGARYMQIFNALAANVNLGTTVPDMVLIVGAADSESFDFGDQEFSTGFSYAITTSAEGSTGPTAACWISVSYL